MGVRLTGRCGMQRDGNGWVPCGAPEVYEVQIQDHWYGMCPDCTAWTRAAYSGVTGVRMTATHAQARRDARADDGTTSKDSHQVSARTPSDCGPRSDNSEGLRPRAEARTGGPGHLYPDRMTPSLARRLNADTRQQKEDDRG